MYVKKFTHFRVFGYNKKKNSSSNQNNPTRGQSFYLLGLEVGINVVTLWTGWIFSEDEWEIISWYNPKFSPISSQPLRNSFVLSFLSTSMHSALLNAVGPWLPETWLVVSQKLSLDPHRLLQPRNPWNGPKFAARAVKCYLIVRQGQRKTTWQHQ